MYHAEKGTEPPRADVDKYTEDFITFQEDMRKAREAKKKGEEEGVVPKKSRRGRESVVNSYNDLSEKDRKQLRLVGRADGLPQSGGGGGGEEEEKEGGLPQAGEEEEIEGGLETKTKFLTHDASKFYTEKFKKISESIDQSEKKAWNAIKKDLNELKGFIKSCEDDIIIKDTTVNQLELKGKKTKKETERIDTLRKEINGLIIQLNNFEKQMDKKLKPFNKYYNKS